MKETFTHCTNCDIRCWSIVGSKCACGGTRTLPPKDRRRALKTAKPARPEEQAAPSMFLTKCAWSTESWNQVQRGDVCVYCNRQPSGLDHIYPVSRSGSNGWQNRAPACRHCDLEKAAMLMVIYLAHRRNGTMPRQHSRQLFIPRQYQMRPLRIRIHEHLGLPHPNASQS